MKFFGVFKISCVMGATTQVKKEKTEEKEESVNLENIVRECERSKANWGLMQNDIVFAVAFWSMVECGFRPMRSLKGKNQSTLPKNWKHLTRKVYEAHFYLPPYHECLVKLLALPADDILCINVLASNLSQRNINLRSLAIYSPGYVPRPEEDTIWCKFSGLSDFHLLLRNAIIWPIRCSILTDKGITNGSLCGLSDEIKLNIIRRLPVGEVLMLSQTCHDLNRICNDQGLWKTIFHRNFKNLCKCSKESQKCDEVVDWKENFKDAYTQKIADGRLNLDSPSSSYHTAPEALYGSEIDFDID